MTFFVTSKGAPLDVTNLIGGFLGKNPSVTHLFSLRPPQKPDLGAKSSKIDQIWYENESIFAFWDPRIGSRVKKVAQDYCFVYNSTRNYTSTELTVHCGSPPIVSKGFGFWLLVDVRDQSGDGCRISLLLIRGGPKPSFWGFMLASLTLILDRQNPLRKWLNLRDFLSSKIGVNSGPTPSSLRDCRTRHFVTHFMHIP